MSILSNALRTAILGTQGVSELLTGGVIHVFSGPIPATADEALDVGGAHTLLITVDNSGSGVSFDTPVNGVLPKLPSETWGGTFAASGAPTFYRWCAASDAGTAAGGASTYRVQGSAGGPLDAVEFDLGANPVTSGNSFTLSVANIRQPSA